MFFSFSINASKSNISPINLVFQKKKPKFEILNVFERLEQAQKEKNEHKKHKKRKHVETKKENKSTEQNTYQDSLKQDTYSTQQQSNYSNNNQQNANNENADINNQEQFDNSQVQQSNNQQSTQVNNQAQQDNGTQSSSAKQEIANAESTNDYNATNGRYYGKYQLDISYLNGDLSPANQDRTFEKYVNDRYGSVENALAFRKVHNWY